MRADRGARGPAELTLTAVALGFAIGLTLTGAITYLALYSGLAVSAAIPAALICTGVIRMVRRRTTLLENNLAQTIASSGEALAVGVVFTAPALVLSGVRQDLDYWEVSLAAALGGVFGVLCVIPLRRSLTRLSPELRFPESEACAKVSRAGAVGRNSLRPALLAVVGGAVFKALQSFAGVISGAVEGAVRIGGRVFYGGIDLSLALVGVGLILELRFASLMLMGGALSWLVAIPLVADPTGVPHTELVGLARQTWSSDIRFVGIGAMIVGGCWSIVQARTSIARGVRAGFAGLRPARGAAQERTDTDLPMRAVLTAIALTALATFGFIWWAVGSPSLALATAIVILVLVVAFAAVSGYIVGQLGSSNNPISGMAISAFFLFTLVFVVARADLDARLALCALLTSLFVCTATATAGDTAQHLATGAMVGATPRRQQLVQLLGVVAFAFVVAPIVVLLQRGYGIGTTDADALKAPQAAIFAHLADGVFNAGRFPERMLWTGVAVGVALVVADSVLKRYGSSFRLFVMPIAIGMYLPFSLSVPLFVGGLLGSLLRGAARRRAGGGPSGDEGSSGEASSPDRAAQASRDRVVLLSSGIITGESLVGLSAAVPKWAGWDVPWASLDSPLLSLAVFGLCLAAVFSYAHRATTAAAPPASVPLSGEDSSGT
ncbi:oligopeptide transporter, OPT family [Streptomyces sp. NPDC047525]|uniref:OPT family oligopeptide transporter n=1 Tax=Streptomyces sp. NPDC047525 TaxID=3155264 RepID=UPI0033E97A58